MYPLTGAICVKMLKNLFRNIKYEIILEVIKNNHFQAYEKEYWRLSGYKRIILQQTKHLQEAKGNVFVKKK